MITMLKELTTTKNRLIFVGVQWTVMLTIATLTGYLFHSVNIPLVMYMVGTILISIFFIVEGISQIIRGNKGLYLVWVGVFVLFVNMAPLLVLSSLNS